jgi:hypothetical protein
LWEYDGQRCQSSKRQSKSKSRFLRFAAECQKKDKQLRNHKNKDKQRQRHVWQIMISAEVEVSDVEDAVDDGGAGEFGPGI